MELIKSAIAGTLESSDVFVIVEPLEEDLEIIVESVVMKQFGEEIINSVKDVLKEQGVVKGRISINDKGALDCTIRARVETAIKRAQEDI